MTPLRWPAARNRRAYALMVVMLLAVVGILSATMVVEFQGSQRLSEERSVEAYRGHHEQQGLAEVVEMWFRMGKPPTINGEASIGLHIKGEGGEEFRIEVSDAQGRVLDSSASSFDDADPSAEYFARAADQLRGTSDAPRLLRTHGPAPVSINAAPREVLVALVQAVDPRGPAGAFAEAVIKQREDGRRIDLTGLKKIITEANFKDRESSQAIEQLFTFDSVLRRVEVFARDPVRRIITHHEGLLLGENRSPGLSGGSQAWAFLTWERKMENDSGAELGARPAR